MPSKPRNELSPELVGLYIDEAAGRAGAVVAALTVREAPDDDDVDWARMAAHSLKGLTAQAGDAALAEEVHAVEDALVALRSLPAADRVEATAVVVARVRAVEARLVDGAGPSGTRAVALSEIAEAAEGEVRRIAARRQIALSVELTVPDGVTVPRRIAGVIVDVLGHILRNAVAHGSSRGGAIRIAFRTGAGSVSIVVGDRGNAESRTDPRPTDMESGRGVGLHAARSRLSAIGGELAISPAPWGGTSVTVSVPLPDAPRPGRRR